MPAHDLLHATLSGALLGLLLVGVRWLLTRGGAPSRSGSVLTYRPKPGLQGIGVLMLLAGLWLCGFAVVLTLRGDWQDALWALLIALFPLLLAALALLPRILLKDSGIHHSRGILGTLHLPWSELSHYETNGSAVVSVLLLRSRHGATIKVSNRAFAVNDLLRNVVQRSGIRQQPYRRQSWSRM